MANLQPPILSLHRSMASHEPTSLKPGLIQRGKGAEPAARATVNRSG